MGVRERPPARRRRLLGVLAAADVIDRRRAAIFNRPLAVSNVSVARRLRPLAGVAAAARRYWGWVARLHMATAASPTHPRRVASTRFRAGRGTTMPVLQRLRTRARRVGGSDRHRLRLLP